MPEYQVDPILDGFTTFGKLLQYLRERARLTQRELAAQAGYHHSYISYLEKDLRTPDESVVLARFVPALGLKNEPKLTARLLELASEKQRKSYSPARDMKPAVSESKANSLPTSLTSILGRGQASAALNELLNRADVRLITIVGPPGVGKTRLALHVAEQVQKDFTDGVAFINLTPITQPELVLPAVGSAFDVQEPVAENLKTSLRDKNVLILMDNFEQVLDAAPQLVELLGNAPGVKILVTSREALHLRGEYEFPLNSLPVSNDSGLDSPAVQLFIERARAVKPDFQSDEETASRVAEICRRLDGLPLAIELAAARARIMSLPTMLEQLGNRFEWLTSGGRDLALWRRTLWSAINWSYTLLSVQERALFCRLSVFGGGWTIEAAEAVCSDPVLCAPSDIFSLLMQLADKSLVTAEIEQERFGFLESLREFAFEKLKESGNLERVQSLHYGYFLKFTQTAQPHLDHGNEHRLWLDKLENEHNNLRGALDWATETPERAALAIAFGHAIHSFWLTHSYLSEARRWLGRILSLDHSPDPLRATLLRYASDYASAQGDLESAKMYEEEALAISKTLDDEDGVYHSMDGIAMLAGMQGDYAQTVEMLEKVLVYRRQTGNSVRLTATLNNLANATRELGHLQRADELYTEAISITESSGNYHSLAHALQGLAEVHIDHREYTQAVPLLRRSISVRQELGFLQGVSTSLDTLALCLYHLEHASTATQLESASEKIRRKLGVAISPAAREKHKSFISCLRFRLGDVEFEKSWSDGQAMKLEQVIALALKDESSA